MHIQKQTRAVHTTPMQCANNVLDCVFMDLHGPIPIEAIPARTKYWLPIVDDMSGYTHISLLWTKDAMLEAFKRFKASIENQMDRAEQNGAVERINQHISEGATTLLTESNLPPSFWGLAVMAYVHVMNQCPS